VGQSDGPGHDCRSSSAVTVASLRVLAHALPSKNVRIDQMSSYQRHFENIHDYTIAMTLPSHTADGRP
jgi:hypothetical protein